MFGLYQYPVSYTPSARSASIGIFAHGAQQMCINSFITLASRSDSISHFPAPVQIAEKNSDIPWKMNMDKRRQRCYNSI